MRFGTAHKRGRSRPSLTPMIDVVFLLLVFFMLAARFGTDTALALSPPASGTAEWQGPPRLVEYDGQALFLNGARTAPEDLAQALGDLMPTPDAPVLLRAREGATLSHLTTLMDALRGAGFGALLVVE